ncbi:hypothetical protein ABEB36_005698 [Hypothenemus hampei]|uniref:Uncharacterized protein n=1 Tax=Hypothenemus hampei TaxID=57062 RepID=A0ABD1F2Z3_HYPHA
METNHSPVASENGTIITSITLSQCIMAVIILLIKATKSGWPLRYNPSQRHYLKIPKSVSLTIFNPPLPASCYAGLDECLITFPVYPRHILSDYDRDFVLSRLRFKCQLLIGNSAVRARSLSYNTC